jgi:hypothetical protein
MGKRYGRNQKRKHREQIAELEIKLSGAHQKFRDYRQSWMDNFHSLERLLALVYSVAPNSIIFNPRIVGQSDFPPSSYSILYSEIPRVEWPPTGKSLAIDPSSFSVLCHRLDVFVHDFPESFQKMIHLRLGTGQGESVYYISDEALQKFPGKYLVEYISPNIAAGLLACLKKGEGNGS